AFLGGKTSKEIVTLSCWSISLIFIRNAMYFSLMNNIMRLFRFFQTLAGYCRGHAKLTPQDTKQKHRENRVFGREKRSSKKQKGP
ncbi:MAG: hypothetical protein J6Y80_01290, partial [Victivallales bacterium]|nr:hypothetical protein [Victivallales bacterium]